MWYNFGRNLKRFKFLGFGMWGFLALYHLLLLLLFYLGFFLSQFSFKIYFFLTSSHQGMLFLKFFSFTSEFFIVLFFLLFFYMINFILNNEFSLSFISSSKKFNTKVMMRFCMIWIKRLNVLLMWVFCLLFLKILQFTTDGKVGG